MIVLVIILFVCNYIVFHEEIMKERNNNGCHQIQAQLSGINNIDITMVLLADTSIPDASSSSGTNFWS